MYAQAHLADPVEIDGMTASHMPDAITLNGYFGSDGVQPFMDAAGKFGRGLFLLVQTSNPSARQIQGIAAADGESVCESMARLVSDWGASLVGKSGFSSVGAVASPHSADSMRRLRERMPRAILLVPGFGAQGRGAADVAPCFNAEGRGALIAASRSVIYAFEKDDSADWRTSVARACRAFADEVGALVAR
jgi:orotidine-5'-phosphate decarboxylase